MCTTCSRPSAAPNSRAVKRATSGRRPSLPVSLARPPAAPSIAKTSSFGSSAGQGRSGLVDARDVAAVAAEIITSPAGHAGKTYWLTGPELVSNYDVAAVLSKLVGRTITYRELTFEQNKDAMIRAGVPEQIAEMNAQAFSLTADGDAEWLTQDVPSLLGRPARSFEQFTTDYAAAFSAPERQRNDGWR